MYVFINYTYISVDKMGLHTWLEFVLRVIMVRCEGIFTFVLQEEAISVIY